MSNKIAIEELQLQGYDVYASAQKAYKVDCRVLTYDEFDKMCRSLAGALNKEYWGVFRKDDSKLVAIAINTVFNNCCEYNTLKATPESLHDRTYPYYGLIYEMNRYYLQDLGLEYVNDGARSLTEHSNIQQFLIDKFKFRKAYCRLQIVYKRWVEIMVNILYPFRHLIPISSVKSILRLEAMRRGEI